MKGRKAQNYCESCNTWEERRSTLLRHGMIKVLIAILFSGFTIGMKGFQFAAHFCNYQASSCNFPLFKGYIRSDQ